MSLRRTLGPVLAVVVAGAVVFAPADGWARGTNTSRSQAPAWSNGGTAAGIEVTKDGSQMTVVGNDLDRNIPIVEVANNSKLKKKQPPSFWNRLTHPSQWFGSSKSRK